MHTDPIVIISAKRTPIGHFQGYFKDIPAPELGAIAIRAALEQSTLTANALDEVLMGCVLTAGIGQAPARQAALKAGLPEQVSCTTINKVCGSGMKAIMLAHDSLMAGSTEIVVAGGMESMSQAPYLLPKARTGYRLGHQTALDHLFYDGLEDAYQKSCLMGELAELCAEKFNFSRKAQDDFALHSLERALQATQHGLFKPEIAPVSVSTQIDVKYIDQDEGPLTAHPEKIPQLKPVFKKEGTITAANASSISDGAAALILMKRSRAQKLGLSPLATITGFASHAQAPAWFTTAPIAAIQTLLRKISWTPHDVDLFEINEAFAVVPMAVMATLNIPHEKVNIQGGACALGHPIGASGARILVSLIYSLRQRGLARGVASLCLGGGEAVAMGIAIT